MTDFIRTDAADAFIATAQGRETDIEVMRAIATVATSESDAIAIWENGPRDEEMAKRIVQLATADGGCADDLQWGEETLAGTAA